MSAFLIEDESTLRAALLSGAVPETVSMAEAMFATSPTGLMIEPSVAVSRGDAKKMSRAGIRRTRKKMNAPRELSCWAEALPTERAEEPRAPVGEVLFTTNGSYASLAGELLRLGCDAQQLALLSGGGVSAMIITADPPYYSLLRSLERDGTTRAYLPTAPGSRVYVEASNTHPLSAMVGAAEGELVLIPAGGERWLRLPNGPYTDLYDVVDVALLGADKLEASPATDRVPVTLRFVRAEPRRPSLFILPKGMRALEELLVSLPEVLVRRFSFARFEHEGRELVALLANEHPDGPPSIEIAGEAYARHRDVRQLYLPVGRAIDPPLRPARLTSRLARDPDELVWLTEGDEKLTQIRVAANAFFPLSDVVEYIIDDASDRISHWVKGASFAFDKFSSSGREWADLATEKDPVKKRRRPREAPREEEPDELDPLLLSADEEETATHVRVELPRAAPLKVSEAAAAVAALQEAVRADTRPLDHPDRLLSWVDLGEHQRAAGMNAEFLLSFSRALFSSADPATYGKIRDRLVELICEDQECDAGSLYVRHRDASDVDAVRAAAVACLLPKLPADVPDLVIWLSEHENALDVRLVWLIRARLHEGDRLGMVRARDAALASIASGLSLARDVPAFVRRVDGSEASHLGETLTGLFSRFSSTKRKPSSNEAPPELTRAYVSLLFAWGFARLGLDDLVRDQLALTEATIDLVEPSPGDDYDARMDQWTPHRWLHDAFHARIAQARAGFVVGAPLPASLMDWRERMKRFSAYKVDRLRQASRILEPAQVDPFGSFYRGTERDDGALVGLVKLPPLELVEALDSSGTESVRDLLTLIGLLPPSLALPRLRDAIGRAASLSDEKREACALLAITLAGHLENPELVKLALELTPPTTESVSTVLAETATLVRRAGLAQFGLDLTEQVIPSGTSFEDVRSALKLATVATALGGGGSEERLEQALVAAHEALPGLRMPQRLDLTREIALAIGRTTPARAVAGVDQLMNALPEITDTFNTNSHFCLSVLNFMESMVLALVSDDLTLGDWGRSFVEEDEQIVRRRVHHDVQRA